MPIEAGIGVGDSKALVKRIVLLDTGGSESMSLLIEGEVTEIAFLLWPGGRLFDSGKAHMVVRTYNLPEHVVQEVTQFGEGQEVTFPLPLRTARGEGLAFIVRRTALT